MKFEKMKNRWALVASLLVAVVMAGGGAVWVYHAYGVPFWLKVALACVSASGMLFGVNTVTYETPVSGVTPPTATQARTHEQVSAIITGDGAATTFTITHNWGLSTSDNNAGWAEVEYEYLLAAGYTAAALITSKTANAVVFSCTAFTGAGLRVRLKRPWSPTR